MMYKAYNFKPDFSTKHFFQNSLTILDFDRSVNYKQLTDRSLENDMFDIWNSVGKSLRKAIDVTKEKHDRKEI